MEKTRRLVDPGELVDSGEAADLLGITRQRVGQLVREGRLCPVFRRERVTLFHREDVQEYAATKTRGRVVTA